MKAVESPRASADIDTMDAPNPSAMPTFASRTPLRIGAVGLIARDLDLLTTTIAICWGSRCRSAATASARLGTGGVTLIEIEHRPDAKPDDPATAGLYHTAFLMPTRADHARWIHAHRTEPRADHRRVRPRRQRGVLSRRSRGQRHRGLQRPATRTLAARGRPDRDADQAARHRGDPARGRPGERQLSGGARGLAHRAHPSAGRQRRAGPRSSIAARSVST